MPIEIELDDTAGSAELTPDWTTSQPTITRQTGNQRIHWAADGAITAVEHEITETTEVLATGDTNQRSVSTPSKLRRGTLVCMA